MKAAIKKIMSSTVDINVWQPISLLDFEIGLEVDVGPAEQSSQDIFQIIICSVDRLIKNSDEYVYLDDKDEIFWWHCRVLVMRKYSRTLLFDF